jgi:hypothetical protein
LKGQICFCSYSKSKDISVWEEALKQLQSVGHAEMEDSSFCFKVELQMVGE